MILPSAVSRGRTATMGRERFRKGDQGGQGGKGELDGTVQRDQAAEIIAAPLGGGHDKHGSGYRVTSSSVITAAHVVAAAGSIRVRFNADRPDEWSSAARVAFRDDAADVAVLEIAPRTIGERVVTADFGQVGERAAVINCQLLGFPRFKMRDDPAESGGGGTPTRYRDSHQADGRIASLSNWREGTLEITVTAPPPDPDPAHSPWEGMSGAAVWSGNRIVGLVTEHFPRDGANRLAASRTDQWYARITPEKLTVLRELIAIPLTAAELPDVISPESAAVIAADYLEQVEAIAPDVLVGRDSELAEIATFCAGDETYQWWRAGPWAGKTALATWLALHPPVGVVAVSFFITGRLSGQSDSEAFTEAMIQQLAVVAGEPVSLAATTAARDGQRRRLLRQAAFRAHEAKKQLLLIIDGLDEDTGSPETGVPSIASLLPERPPEGVHVLVTSRPHPGVPVDVPGKHPLRNCHVRNLSRSPYAEHLEVEAKRELAQHLRGGDPLKVDVIGFLVAAGGGLTLRELVELTGTSQPRLEAHLGGVFGRTLSARTARDVPPSARSEELYLFAHETLREMAAQQLAYDLDGYLRRLYAWADRYHDGGWPDDTPRYLLRPYAQVLAGTGAHDRLADLATDRRRHDLMLRRTLGDAAALAEITDAQQALLTQLQPSLIVLAELAIEQDRLIGRNREVPDLLPAVWIRIGRQERGIALARSITDPVHQARALALAALALGEVGQLDRAEEIARTVSSPAPQIWALGRLAAQQGRVGRQGSARRLIRDAELVTSTIASPRVRAMALRELAVALADTGPEDELERILELSNQVAADGGGGEAVLVETVRAVAEAGQPELAANLVGKISPERQSAALEHVAVAIAAAGRFDEANHVASRAVRMERDPTAQARITDRTTVAAARRLAASGRWPAAKKALREIFDESLKSAGFADIAADLAVAGQLEESAEAVEEAEWALAEVVLYPDRRAAVMGTLTAALVPLGRADRAEELAKSVSDDVQRDRVYSSLVIALAANSDTDRALRLVSEMTDSAARAQALVRVASILARNGDPIRAELAAVDAERSVRNTVMATLSPGLLYALMSMLVAAGELRCAELITHGITDLESRVRAAELLVMAFTRSGDQDHARLTVIDTQRAAMGITGPASRAQALLQLAGYASAARIWDAVGGVVARAEAAVRDIAHPVVRAMALTELAGIMAAAGQAANGIRLVGEAEQTAARVVDSATRARTQAAKEHVVHVIEQPTWSVGATHAPEDAPVADDSLQAAILESLDGFLGQGRIPADPLIAARAAAMAAELGQVSAADGMARSIGDEALLALTLARIATIHSAAGRHKTAEELADEALTRAAQHPSRDTVVAGVAIALARYQEQAQGRTGPSDLEYPQVNAPLRTADLRHEAHRVDAPPSERSGSAAKSSTADMTTQDRLTLARAAAAAFPGRFHIAEQAIAAIGSPDLRAQTRAKVAAVSARTGNFPLSTAIIAGITDPGMRAEAMGVLAITAGASGQRDLALRLVAQIDDFVPAEVLAATARVYAASGEPGRAAHVALRAERAVDFIDDPWQRTRLLSELAVVHLKSGRHDEAMHNAERAIQAAATVSHLGKQAATLSGLARELAGSGMRPLAGRAAAAITDLTYRVEALTELYAADADEVDGLTDNLIRSARLAIGEITTPWLQARAATWHAIRLAAVGRMGDAELAAGAAEQLLGDPGVMDVQYVRILTELGIALGSTERLDRAASAAAGWNAGRLQAQCLTEIAVAFASQDRQERAVQMVNDAARAASDISEPTFRAATLREMDECLADAGSALASEQLRHLCGQVLAGPSWRDALPMVCRTDPHAFARLASLLVPPAASPA
jgi:Trypsin-like peptidase domain